MSTCGCGYHKHYGRVTCMEHYGEEVKNKGFFDKLEDLNDRFDEWFEWEVLYSFTSKANFYDMLAIIFRSQRLAFIARLLRDIEGEDYELDWYADTNEPFLGCYWPIKYQDAFAAREVANAKFARAGYVALYNAYKFWWMGRK